MQTIGQAMKPILQGGLWLALAAGCHAPGEPGSTNELVGAQNLWTVPAYAENAARAAVIRERTLYAQHFEQDAPELNQLGRRDVAWLAEHFRGGAFDLSVRRAGAAELLYQARLESVRAAFEQAGIDATLIGIEDGLPGGDGTSAARAAEALEADPALELGTTMTTGDGQ
jgi:hypothetical protein